MAGGTRGKKGKGTRAKASAGKPSRPALGNDPFTRGAAPRAIAAPPAAANVAALAATPTPTSPARGSTLRQAQGSPRADSPLAPSLSRGDPQGAAPTSTPTPSPSPTSTPPLSVAAATVSRLDAVERKMETALDGLEERLLSVAGRSGLSGAAGELRETLGGLLPALRAKLAPVTDLVRLLEPPERLDRHGMDARLVERTAPLLELLYASWWRAQARGIERVPASGPVVVVANRAGLVPWDALVLRHALRRDHPARRDLRPLLDDRELDAGLVGSAAVRLGAVRASPDAAERLLREGVVVGVFPEGSAGARKPWRDRYRIQHFGRGGFVKLALRTGAVVVPCAVVGSEETSPAISRTGWLAEQLGLPLMSSSPLLRLAPAAALPLPARWTLHFGEPIDLAREGAHPDDAPRVLALTERVRAALQALLDEGVAARASVFL